MRVSREGNLVTLINVFETQPKLYWGLCLIVDKRQSQIFAYRERPRGERSIP